MSFPKALVICGDGINCDAETAFALELAGFAAQRLHTSDLLDNDTCLADAKLLAIPGGFSFGDEIASGKVLALKIKQKLNDILHQFVESGNIVLGICNGFQVLVQLGLLPLSDRGAPRVVTLAGNSGGRFINSWVDLAVDHNAPGHFFDGLDTLQLPIRHGQGRLALGVGHDDIVETVKRHAPLRYKDDVNGSFDKIAALANTAGNVLGLMPHPEAFVRWTQHPNWYRQRSDAKRAKPAGNGEQELLPHGLVILRNAAKIAGLEKELQNQGIITS